MTITGLQNKDKKDEYLFEQNTCVCNCKNETAGRRQTQKHCAIIMLGQTCF